MAAGGGGGCAYVNYLYYSAWFSSASNITTSGGTGSNQNGFTGTAFVNSAPVLGPISVSSVAHDGSGNLFVSVGLNDMDHDKSKMKVQWKQGSDCTSGTSAATLLSSVTTTFPDTSGYPTVSNTLPYQIGNDSGYEILATTTTNTVQFVWDSQADAPNSDGTYCLALTANDFIKDSATVYVTTTIDNAAPTNGKVAIDASLLSSDGSASTTAGLSFSANDFSNIYVMYSLDPNFTGAGYIPMANSTIAIGTDVTTTVYAKFKDDYDNVSATTTAEIPDQPTNVIIVDASNLTTNPPMYGLLVAWKKNSTLTAPSTFGAYRVFRSTDQTNWTQIGTSTDININYYADYTTASGTTYYYKVDTLSANGDISRYSSYATGTLSTTQSYGVADGVQDGSEGGGGTLGPATISNVASTSIDPAREDIVWDTDQLSDSTVSYSTTSGTYSNTAYVASLVNNSSNQGQHIVHLTGLTPSTTYYFKVTSKNTSGVDTSSTGYNFTTPDGTVISSVSSGSLTNHAATITWTTDQLSDSAVTYATDRAFSIPTTVSDAPLTTNHSLSISGLNSNTKYYFYVASAISGGVTTTDANYVDGSETDYSFITTNDTEAPLFVGADPFTITTLINTSTITWQTDKSANSEINYGTNSGSLASSTFNSSLTILHSLTLTDLTANTTYYFSASSTDVNGNSTTSAEYSFTTLSAPDTTPPVISGLSVENISLTGATVVWTTDEKSNATVNYGTSSSSLATLVGDVSDFSTTTHSIVLSGLTPSTTYYYQVRAQDSSGNATTTAVASFSTTPDTTAPTISTVTTTVVAATSAVITWNTDKDATTLVDYGTSTSYGSLYSNLGLTSDHSATLSNLATDTLYYYRVISVDAYSNTTTDDNSGASYNFTTAEAPGTTVINQIIQGGGGGGGGGSLWFAPPNISAIAVDQITSSTAVVSWKTDLRANSLVNYGLSSSYGQLGGDYMESVSNHSVTLSGLVPGATYHFQVASVNTSDKVVGQSADETFTTLTAAGTAPATSSSTPSETSGQTVASTTAKTPTQQASTSDLLVRITSAPSTMISDIMNALVKNPYLSSVPQNTFVKAITEMTDKVVAAPTIVGLKPQVDVQGTTATVRWTTDKDASSLVAYAAANSYQPNVQDPYTNAAANPNEFGTTHDVQLANLTPGTTYHFQVRSKGLLGPEAQSQDLMFTTGSVLPTISGIYVKKTGDTSVTVNWQTNLPVSSMVNYTDTRNNKTFNQGAADLVTNHSISLTNLQGQTTYSVILQGIDGQGNQVSSVPVTFATTIDRTLPVISNLSTESTLYPGQQLKVQSIITWDTDKPSTSQVFYHDGGGVAYTSSTLDTALTMKHVVVLTDFAPASVYKFWVASTDISNNTGKSEIFSILTPQQKQTILDIMINNFEQVFGWTKKITG